MSASPEQVEREIDRTRDHIVHTIDEMQQQFSPRRLVEHAVDYARDASDFGGDFGRNLTQTLRDNPLPAVLAGVGLTWLMMAGRGGHEQTGDGGARFGHAGVAAEVRGTAGEWGQDAKARAAAAGERVAETASRFRAGAESAGEQAREYAASAGRAARQMGTRGAGLVEQHPLVVAAAAVGVGALLASLMPQSRREQQLLGPAAERAKESARESAEDTAQTAMATASRAAEAARESAGEHGPTGERLRREGAAVAHSTAEAAKAAGEEARRSMRERGDGGPTAAGSLERR